MRKNNNLLRSGNPALNSKAFENFTVTQENTMTLQGTVNKTIISLMILVVCGGFTYYSANTSWVWPGIIGGFIVALVTVFKKEWSPITVPIYAVLEGLALGGISHIYANLGFMSQVDPVTGFVSQQSNNIVSTAILLTVGIFFSLLFAYKSRIIKVTQNFRLGVFAATGGIAIFYMVSWVISMFGGQVSVLDPTNGSMMSIGVSLFIVVIASLNLVMDFDFIEEASEKGVPKYMEWYGAFGLLETLVWLYLEILRLLAKLNSRD